MKKTRIRINWHYVFAAVTVLLLFGLTFRYTLNVAATFCKADDWRYIELYLRPFLDNNFNLKTLWLDRSHPLPLYSYLFLLNAKYFNLQSQYFSFFAIFSQLLLGFYVTYKLLKSLENRHSNVFVKLTGVIMVNLSIFSFTTQVPYYWGIMTIMYFSFLLMIIPTGLCDRNIEFTLNKKLLLYIFFLFSSSFISLFLFFDFSIIFHFATLFIILLMLIIEKQNRKMNTVVFFILSLSSIAAWYVIYVLIGHKAQSMNLGIAEGLLNMISNPIRMYTTMGVELLSGIFNSKFIGDYLKTNSLLHRAIAIAFMSSYLYVFVAYFVRKIHRITILPPVMMLYVILFIVSLFLFRNNAFKTGIYTLSTPRYIQYYLVGIAGYFWTIFLLIDNKIEKKPHRKKLMLKLMFFFSFLLAMNWGYNFIFSQYSIQPFRIWNERVSDKLRNRLDDHSIELTNAIIGNNKNVDKQLKLLKEHHLNIFAPNHPNAKGQSEKTKN